MPTHLTPRHKQPYYLMCVDKSGVERTEENGTLLSERILETVRSDKARITDILLMSHGWKGDVPAAVDQYNQWADAMLDCTHDRLRAKAERPDFSPLVIGFHWPSLPFGEDDMGGNAFDVAVGTGEEGFIDTWADRIADTPAARSALRTLFSAALKDIEPDRLDSGVLAAYQVLNQEANLAYGVPNGPEESRAEFDPQQLYLDTLDGSASFSSALLGGLLSPLRQLSFWTMKKRARICGETGGHNLIASIRAAAGSDVRIHLMGHSFGCIVVSSMLRGTDVGHKITASSALLVQGALSLWTFAKEIPNESGMGWFRPVVDKSRVEGPLIITTSRFDSAVGSLYPLAAGAAGQVDYDPVSKQLPTYGALGTFGANGTGVKTETRSLQLGDSTSDHNLKSGRIYNVNCDAVIKTGRGLTGAHNDIAHAELGHLFWQAILTHRQA